MRYLILTLLIISSFISFSQEKEEKMDDIFKKLEHLEKQKKNNKDQNTVEIINSVEPVIVVVDSSLIAQDTSLGTAVISADTIYIQPIIHFDTTNYVVGEVIQGDTVVVIFNFMNKGTDNLEITDVLPDCSCTSPEYTAGTIQPGESGLIKVVYDSKEDIGGFLKTVTVLHNSGEGYTFLELRGFVSPKL